MGYNQYSYKELSDALDRNIQEAMRWQDEVIHKHIMSKPPYTTKGIWEYTDRDVEPAYSFSNLQERREIAKSHCRELLNDYIANDEILLLL
jgi:hypothetical protein